MDLVAGLHWLRENLGAFGGDPERLALLGHGTGAALANFLAVSPMAKGKEFNCFAACVTDRLRTLQLSVNSSWLTCCRLYLPLTRYIHFV